MASLIPANGTIYNCADTAPPPSKDYCQIIVTWDQVVFRLWKVAIRNDIKPSPSETKDDYEDFLMDDRLHSEIMRCFGKNTLNYIKGLADGHIDYLPRLPQHLLVHILRFLDLEDISRVACLSKMFRKLCNSDALWEKLYEDHIGAHNVGDELRSLAEAVGWKKLFFTNKLQLQMMLRRVAAQRKNMDLVDLEEEEEFFNNPTEFKPQLNGQSQLEDQNQSELFTTQTDSQSGLITQSDNQSEISLQDDHDNLNPKPIKTAAWGKGEEGDEQTNELLDIYRRNNTDIFDEEHSNEQSSEEVEDN